MPPSIRGSSPKARHPVRAGEARHGDSALEIKGWPLGRLALDHHRRHRRGRTIETMLEKGKTLAAQVLEADESDIAYRSGVFEVVGTDRQIGLFDSQNAPTR